MLGKLSELIKSHDLRIRGIIHVGAHHGEEYEQYVKNGIKKVWMIEPSAEAFSVLKERFGNNSDVVLINYALGSIEGKAKMYTEKQNAGQSNSLLKPALHLKEFPKIVFDGEETVDVFTLDHLRPSDQYNMIVADVQGFELEVLKGAKRTLDNIDYIYLEVNRDEVYENCAKIWEIDTFLKGFSRVYTHWNGENWGDALYCRIGLPYEGMDPVQVPEEFLIHQAWPYPPDNNQVFEEWFKDNYDFLDLGGRVYLPIQWTAYYVHANYGKDLKKMQMLQTYIDSLDTRKKYFTITQYDDGILHDISKLNIKVFGPGGVRVNEIIPLLSPPHQITLNNSRDIFASFIGSAQTHAVRQHVMGLGGSAGFYVSDFRHTIYDYCKVLSRSTFALCPRGYGEQSFRIAEAIQYGAIPVIITNEIVKVGAAWTAYPKYIPFEDFGVLIQGYSVSATTIERILRKLSPGEIAEKQSKLAEAYDTYYTYGVTKQRILSSMRSYK